MRKLLFVMVALGLGAIDLIMVLLWARNVIHAWSVESAAIATAFLLLWLVFPVGLYLVATSKS